MTHCAKPNCKLTPWRRSLCFTHWRESQGFVFDLERRLFVKQDGRRAAKRRKLVVTTSSPQSEHLTGDLEAFA